MQKMAVADNDIAHITTAVIFSFFILYFKVRYGLQVVCALLPTDLVCRA